MPWHIAGLLPFKATSKPPRPARVVKTPTLFSIGPIIPPAALFWAAIVTRGRNDCDKCFVFITSHRCTAFCLSRSDGTGFRPGEGRNRGFIPGPLSYQSRRRSGCPVRTKPRPDGTAMPANNAAASVPRFVKANRFPRRDTRPRSRKAASATSALLRGIP